MPERPACTPMVGPLEEAPIGAASLLALAVAAGVAVYAIYRLDGRRRWGATLRRRWVLGVPWGTLLVVGFILFVYLVVQGAAGRLRDPVVIAFRAWSYGNPVGMLTSAFAHSGLGHVTGNLLGTIVFAPIAEYAWSHYPTERGSESFAGLRSNPYARIGGFVGAVLLVGLATSLFIPGASIGFSGVVFAFAGFAIVTKPVAAVFAIAGERVVRLAYYTLQRPVITDSPRTQFVEPWWADIAVQAHAQGLILGILLAVALVARRRHRPEARHVWFAIIVYAVAQGLYALYWQFGASTFVMFRAAGLAVVLVLGTLAVAAVAASPRQWIPRSSLTTRHLAAGFLLAIVVGIAIAAVPYNLIDVREAPADGVEVRDYTVTYAEEVPHGYVGAVRIPGVGDRLVGSVNASGVIVVSPDRDAWQEAVSAGRLGFEGQTSVTVGGLGWREAVVVNRTTWNAIDAGNTYKVYLRPPEDERQLAFAAEPVTVAPTVAGVNLTIEPATPGYRLNATRNGDVVGTARMPGVNETATIAGLTVERRADTLVVERNETRVRIARYERGRRQG